MTLNNLPQELSPLKTLASNYWWSWNQECYELFAAFDKEEWTKTRTPLKTMNKALTDNLGHVKSLAADTEYVAKLNKAVAELESYLNTPAHPNYQVPTKLAESKGPVAYFCAEFGIHESLPIYSGGLGILAGDHVKSASNLGLPLIFIGLFYKNGYFTQQINAEGQQVDCYDTFNAEDLALEEVKNAAGEKVLLNLDLAGDKVKVQVWKANVGKVPLYLLDSDVEAYKGKPSLSVK